MVSAVLKRPYTVALPTSGHSVCTRVLYGVAVYGFRSDTLLQAATPLLCKECAVGRDAV